jgi:hypothetical protein
MERQPLALSPHYREFVRGLRELHRLAVSGQEESPEAETIRDAMDGPWGAMSLSERERARGLSEDLYSLSEPASGGNKVLNSQAQAQLADASAAWRQGDLDSALELLRQCADSLTPGALNRFRGEIWLRAGDPETAALFLAHGGQPHPGTTAPPESHTPPDVPPSHPAPPSGPANAR